MNTAKERLEQLNALSNGKTLQYFSQGSGKWHDSRNSLATMLDVGLTEVLYRVKPEPRVIYINVYKKFKSGPFESQEMADKAALNTRLECVRFVEDL